ncbi:hypothetical protein K0M31_012710 [Melipona bicolor]|uniref:Uncharacterized protein n=1 Tax=Melipona bicolor TaxID=60889 RepID=A0AA40FJI1_9HYME|nr:hypothetical protein K0M31_012710 [Melipona bicolor]
MAQVWTKERGRGGVRRWRRRRQGAESDGESGGPLPSEERRKSTGSSNPASTPRAGAAASEKTPVCVRVRESAKRERRVCPAGEDDHVATRIETHQLTRTPLSSFSEHLRLGSPRNRRVYATQTPRVKPFLRPTKGWVGLSANGRKETPVDRTRR